MARKALAPRDLEAQLLIKAAAKLQSVREDWHDEDKGALDEALTYNRKLWTILSTSATRNENPLPQEIKNNIGSLGVFVLSHTLDLQLEPRPEKLTVLITINREIAAGLRAGAGAGAEAPAAASAGSGITASF